MKNYLLYFCVATFMAATLSACTGDEMIVGNETEGAKQEAPTYATFDIAIDGPSTKGNLVSDAGESDAISSIRLLVYKEMTPYNGICEADTTIPGSNPSATVLVTSGWKKILVIANDHTGGNYPIPKAFTFPKQKGKTLDKLISDRSYPAGVNKLTLNEVDFGMPALTATPAPLASLDYSNIAGPAGFVFSNSLADTSSRRELKSSISSSNSYNGGIPDPTKNHFTIYVKRTVAKITTYTTAGSSTLDGSGTLSNLFWGVRNQNRAVALFHIPTSSGKPQAPFFNEVDGKSWAELSNLATYKPFWWTGDAIGAEINIPMPVGAPSTTYYYIPENANNRAVTGNATYIATKATFTPAANTVITSFMHDNGTENYWGHITGVTKGSLSTGTTFYRLTGTSGTGSANINLYGNGWITDGNLYRNIDDARRMAYIAEHNGEDIGYTSSYTPTTIRIDTYQNGICYYRANINDGTNTYIVRNIAYCVNITANNTLGYPNLSDLDEDSMRDKPIDEPTYVTASIRIIPWLPVNVTIQQ